MRPRILVAAATLAIASAFGAAPSAAATFDVTYSLHSGGLSFFSPYQPIVSGTATIRYQGSGPYTLTGTRGTIRTLAVSNGSVQLQLLSPATNQPVVLTGYLLPSGFHRFAHGPAASQTITAAIKDTIGNILSASLANFSIEFSALVYSTPYSSTLTPVGQLFVSGSEVSRTQVVPEPAPAPILASGLVTALGVGWLVRRRRADRRDRVRRP